MKFSTIAATTLCAAVATAAPSGAWGEFSWRLHTRPVHSHVHRRFMECWPRPVSIHLHILCQSYSRPSGERYHKPDLHRWSSSMFRTPITRLYKLIQIHQGAVGYYDFGINSNTNTICYNITLIGFRGQYQSPALTATHIHEAARGQNGLPRVAFPNPVGDEQYANSAGCIKGPFRTGLNVTGTTTDTGATFNVRQIEQNPAGFFADVHSSLAVPGAVRGQIA